MFKELWGVIGKYVIGAGILVISLLLLYFGLRGTTASYFQGVLDKQLERYRIEYQQNMTAKDKEIKEKDKQLLELSNQYRITQVAYAATKKELDIIKQEVSNIHEPVDVQEVKDRLRALGFNIK